jgi:hypothetical protein
VNCEEGFEALKNGDFPAAVRLLEIAARETGYTSDIINNAYTVALYRTGDKPRLADIAFRVGSLHLEHDPASAMDYFQRALFAGIDPPRVRQIAQIFESWRVPVPAHSPFGHNVKRVAHVVGCLVSGHEPSQYVRTLTSSLELQGIESTIFTTEWAASWFFNPTGVPQSQSIEIEAEVKIASVDGDFMQRADRIAGEIRASSVQVAFFHGSLAEQITTRVAALHPAAIQINVNHGTEMDADLFEGNIHLSRNALERAGVLHPAEWIPHVSDIEKRLQMVEPVKRQSLGLESASTISATFDSLNLEGSGYLRALSEILQRFPKHVHLFAGGGNVRPIRSYLHSQGVLPQVRFLGQHSDVAPLLSMIDVYLAPFPHSGGRLLLEAMGAGKPVVVLRFPSDSHYNSGAELVGMRELIAPGEADYIEIADKLLRTPAYRAGQGKAMLERFRAEFRPERLGERYKAFIEKF